MPGHALPFAVMTLISALSALPGALMGGWWIALAPAWAGFAVSLLDRALGDGETGLSPATPQARLVWHRRILWTWPALQLALIAGGLWAACRGGHLSTGEGIALMAAIGAVTGPIGITFAHELIHRHNRWERRAGRLLLASVLYGHFETGHLLVHHVHVATPRDPVTARYNEGFWRFFPRVLWGSLAEAWRAERDRLARRGLPPWHRRNPFWQYGAGAAGFLALGFAIGGPAGVGLVALQALVAVFHLELVNYVQHYGLTRLRLPDGRFEPVGPQHSWNVSRRASNWFLINLQRHSDHHGRPDRSFPLLQHHPEETAPQLPAGYPLMCLIATIPPLWRRMMNPRVRAWRRRHYPQVRDWSAAKRGAAVAA
ncbi:MAG: alkane 1-monooxygenase [Paracoccaceae bacterium]|nr:MAG: alkane 1-monooxygenase [Paracoccaceae bacterium]